MVSDKLIEKVVTKALKKIQVQEQAGALTKAGQGALAALRQKIATKRQLLSQLLQRIKNARGSSKEVLKAQYQKKAEELRNLTAKARQLAATKKGKVAIGAAAGAGAIGAYKYKTRKTV
jgi:DNA-binding PadR family transcriptional regulator